MFNMSTPCVFIILNKFSFLLQCEPGLGLIRCNVGPKITSLNMFLNLVCVTTFSFRDIQIGVGGMYYSQQDIFPLSFLWTILAFISPIIIVLLNQLPESITEPHSLIYRL